MNKEIKKILIILALYGISGGMFYNFQEFWMADNNLSARTISIVLSLCALITCSTIFLFSNIIKTNRLKKFAVCLMLIKSFLLFTLYLSYKSNYYFFIKFIIMIEYAIDTQILVLIYPLMALINKNDKLYAIRGIINDGTYYIGVLLVTILIGKRINLMRVSYNSFLLLSSLLMIIAVIILINVKIKNVDNKKLNNNVLSRLIKNIKGDSISKNYLLFVFFGNLGFYINIGLLLTILVNNLKFNEITAGYIKLGLGISSSLLGALIIAKLTLKNNYINIGIKYFGRVIFYLIAIIYPNKVTFFIALFYTALTSSLYLHVTNAPYINRFSNDYQLAFANLSEIITYLARAIGTFLCGFLLHKGIRFNFVFSLITTISAIIFIYKALNLYNKNKGVIYDR